ncbi:MAG: DUF3368 domain-containing protein [Chloroflexi bacterium]|nr:DUF3368 domain-containing protein [Chloroflexota bacterium]
MTIVVADTTPLIGLSILSRFTLLRDLFDTIQIPAAVYREIAVTNTRRIGANEVLRGITDGWVTVKTPPTSDFLTTLQIDLDDGEAEVIAWSLENKADLLLLDERKARAKAKALGLEVTGTIGILLLVKERGINIDIRSSLDQLRNHGFRIGDALYRRILASA